ncbi:SCP2 domain-containing protein [Rhizobium sp. SEMIA 4085]|uniref:SCP2 sterol-binding domain-containing protein n=1 Tax=Rhizobium gallicum bv. gallicum R602sp TaxID=1041138 RepID=A0A0B4XGD0_9HYPH|nr:MULTISPECIES: SCP2 sterol-binding domain-containing protein [Rhizobium]AJD46136.1 SCP2 sterol-binding domain-containing protein [Rhizobium gallicum bv. gallicum R602sp]NNH29163.1 SCP2 domain-containing protein [Rhizobium sp. SEMIA 4085]
MFFRPRLMASLHAVPLPLVQGVSAFLLRQILERHSGLLDRLGAFKETRFAFVPTDLPFCFLVDPARTTIKAFRKRHTIAADATVEGPLALLLALAEGRVDGDAVFFSRRLTVTGDMESVLALRNALDDCDIDVTEMIAKAAGPLRPMLKSLMVSLRKQALTSEGLSWN